MSSRTKSPITDITIRAYQTGEEIKIVNFLSLCYGAWGDIHKWQRLYAEYPGFDKSDIFIIEKNGEVIGHRGLHFRNLVLSQDNTISTASLGDTAIHPLHRGSRLYTKLHETTLRAAKSKSACLALTWNLKGSSTYNRNKKTGFAEIRQAPVYVRVIRPEKLLRAGLFNFIHANEKLRKVLLDVRDGLYFRIGKSQFPVGELLAKADKNPMSNSKGVVIVFSESSIPLLANFRNIGRLQRIKCLALLLALGKVKIKIGSLGIFLRLLGKGVKLLGSL